MSIERGVKQDLLNKNENFNFNTATLRRTLKQAVSSRKLVEARNGYFKLAGSMLLGKLGRRAKMLAPRKSTKILPTTATTLPTAMQIQAGIPLIVPSSIPLTVPSSSAMAVGSSREDFDNFNQVDIFTAVTGADAATATRVLAGALSRGLALENAVSYYFEQTEAGRPAVSLATPTRRDDTNIGDSSTTVSMPSCSMTVSSTPAATVARATTRKSPAKMSPKKSPTTKSLKSKMKAKETRRHSRPLHVTRFAAQWSMLRPLALIKSTGTNP
jgi:hypothetical protein